jgi:hypothetical protein
VLTTLDTHSLSLLLSFCCCLSSLFSLVRLPSSFSNNGFGDDKDPSALVHDAFARRVHAVACCLLAKLGLGTCASKLEQTGGTSGLERVSKNSSYALPRCEILATSVLTAGICDLLAHRVHLCRHPQLNRSGRGGVSETDVSSVICSCALQEKRFVPAEGRQLQSLSTSWAVHTCIWTWGRQSTSGSRESW